MPKQAISFKAKTPNSRYQLRILNIYQHKTQNQLIVVAKYNDQTYPWGYFPTEGMSETPEIQVEVNEPSNVKYYIVNCPFPVGSYYAPQIPFIAINNQSDIPEDEKYQCLYKNELTEEKERTDDCYHYAASEIFPFALLRAFRERYFLCFKLEDHDFLGKEVERGFDLAETLRSKPVECRRIWEKTDPNLSDEEKRIVEALQETKEFVLDELKCNRITAAQSKEVLRRLGIEHERPRPQSNMYYSALATAGLFAVGVIASAALEKGTRLHGEGDHVRRLSILT